MVSSSSSATRHAAVVAGGVPDDTPEDVLMISEEPGPSLAFDAFSRSHSLNTELLQPSEISFAHSDMGS